MPSLAPLLLGAELPRLGGRARRDPRHGRPGARAQGPRGEGSAASCASSGAATRWASRCRRRSAARAATPTARCARCAPRSTTSSAARRRAPRCCSTRCSATSRIGPRRTSYSRSSRAGAGTSTRPRSHLRAFLAAAGDRFDAWRASAERRLAQLEDERRLMSSEPGAARSAWWISRTRTSASRRTTALLAAGNSDFAVTVARYLDDVRAFVGDKLGHGAGGADGRRALRPRRVPEGARPPLQLPDGRLLRRTHPRGVGGASGRRAALVARARVHARAVPRADRRRPALLAQRRAGGAGSSAPRRRGPRSRGTSATSCARRSKTASWLPLARLAPSFSGLTDDEARLAYASSTAAADWLLRHADAKGRARILKLLGEGRTADEALLSVLHRDTDAIDQAVRAEIRAQFAEPTTPGPAAAH